MINVSSTMREDFARDGAICVRNFFTADELAACRRCFDFNIANPGPTAQDIYGDSSNVTYNDLGTPESLAYYTPVLKQLELDGFVADLWGSEHVWYFGEEIFIKRGGVPGRTPWHQDTPYFPAEGAHLANIWISFESLPAGNALEVVRGSHRGPMYDGSSFMDPANPTAPLWGPEFYPTLPDIEAQRKQDPESWDVLSWDLEPGDVIVLHSGCLHGGAPVDEACPDRHTLVLRFFGDALQYRPFPDARPDYFMDLRAFDIRGLKAGEPYRHESFLQMR